MTQSLARQQPTSYGTAKRLRHNEVSIPDAVVIRAEQHRDDDGPV